MEEVFGEGSAAVQLMQLPSELQQQPTASQQPVYCQVSAVQAGSLHGHDDYCLSAAAAPLKVPACRVCYPYMNLRHPVACDPLLCSPESRRCWAADSC